MEVDHTILYGALGAITAAITAVGARVQLSHNEFVGRLKSMAEDIKKIREDTEHTEGKLASIAGADMRFAELLKENNDKATKLVTMHEHPDDYDFGNAKTNETVDRIALEVRTTSDLVRDSTAASREATHELKELTGLLRLSLQRTGSLLPKGD